MGSWGAGKGTIGGVGATTGSCGAGTKRGGRDGGFVPGCCDGLVWRGCGEGLREWRVGGMVDKIGGRRDDGFIPGRDGGLMWCGCGKDHREWRVGGVVGWLEWCERGAGFGGEGAEGAWHVGDWDGRGRGRENDGCGGPGECPLLGLRSHPGLLAPVPIEG